MVRRRHHEAFGIVLVVVVLPTSVTTTSVVVLVFAVVVQCWAGQRGRQQGLKPETAARPAPQPTRQQQEQHSSAHFSRKGGRSVFVGFGEKCYYEQQGATMLGAMGKTGTDDPTCFVCDTIAT